MPIFTRFASPMGDILIEADERQGLIRLVVAADAEPDPVDAHRDDAALAEARKQVEGYLAGRRRSFSLSLAPGGSDFQRDVWSALLRIPYGETRTYGELANRLGHEGAARAVSAAALANPVPLLIPCHRVVAADGLGSYSGGQALKDSLLSMEYSAMVESPPHSR
ncbi:methylated-DNA--[protein]-cysteine S-methyltransferase [Billgrantia montanilacus]|uniref:methylated-DNA--[protein]-cysteine S-methyltransferase n=1 Tax=Billgrantia montanilacus TaxID=2282305 RepID=A0A368TSP3_9GAMM|nr:methylated-DNA--[protein]-cysteine S-methyltransferase [Halomonas montanilacus]RCV87630.1 methylated-DNA--[protein]-cysteine S-methyltransferase [Halomonas montanilacus]